MVGDASSTTSGAYSEAYDEPLPEPEPEPEPTVCDLSEPVTLYVSPDDSNSMSSPVQARESALTGRLTAPIRPWEFFNYAQWDYAPATVPGELAIDLQLAEADIAGEYLFQVGIASESVDAADREPMVLTFSIDQSGSMSGHPITMVKDSLLAIAGQLRNGDVVSVIGWSEEQHILLEGHTINGPLDPKFLEVIGRINTNGGTDLAGGLRTAYRIAEAHQSAGVINRVVLLSDGGANIGLTDGELIGAKAGGVDTKGIYMIGVGTGTPDSYNDLLMDQVTDLGRGAAVFIPNTAEATRMFTDRFLETLSTSARDVQIRYDLPPGFEVVQFSGEEISDNPAEVQPQHIAPNDAVVLHQRLRSCDADLSLDATVTVTVSFLDGVTFAPREVTLTRTMAELLGGENRQLLKGAALLAYTDVLTEISADRNALSTDELIEALEAAEVANPGDADLAEIRDVLNALE